MPCVHVSSRQQSALHCSAVPDTVRVCLHMALLVCTGRKRDARAGDGTCTDMTAALLVMESLLEFRAPAAPRAGKPTAQQDIPVHGNYKRYYGYRWGGAGGEDPRLQVLLSLLPRCTEAALAAATRQSTRCVPT